MKSACHYINDLLYNSPIRTDLNIFSIRFQEAVNRADEPGIILRMAQSIDISPALLARMILEQHYERLAPEVAVSGEIFVY